MQNSLICGSLRKTKRNWRLLHFVTSEREREQISFFLHTRSLQKTFGFCYEVHTISFQTFFFVWALLLIVHTWNFSPLRSNLGCNALVVSFKQLLEDLMEVLLCECVNDLRHSRFHQVSNSVWLSASRNCTNLGQWEKYLTTEGYGNSIMGSGF